MVDLLEQFECNVFRDGSVKDLCNSLTTAYLENFHSKASGCIQLIGLEEHVQVFCVQLLGKLNSTNEIYDGVVYTLSNIREFPANFEEEKENSKKSIFSVEIQRLEVRSLLVWKQLTQQVLWVFGYGSLIHKPGDLSKFCSEKCWGLLKGYSRRFYQGSPDHRGTFSKPGRVVTLTQEAQAETWGVLFRFDKLVISQVLCYLTYREQGGYTEEIVSVFVPELGKMVDALVYIAKPSNCWYLGEASDEVIAQHIFCSSGPSGPNSEYILKLEMALLDRGEGFVDEHTVKICDKIRDLQKVMTAPSP